MADTSLPVFTYGSLMDEEMMKALLDRHVTGIPAVLEGFTRAALNYSVFPSLMPDPGNEVHGLLYETLTRDEQGLLAQYEGLMYAKKTVRVRTSADILPAYVYMGVHEPPVRRIRNWDIETFNTTHKRRTLALCRAFRRNHLAVSD